MLMAPVVGASCGGCSVRPLLAAEPGDLTRLRDRVPRPPFWSSSLWPLLSAQTPHPPAERGEAGLLSGLALWAEVLPELLQPHGVAVSLLINEGSDRSVISREPSACLSELQLPALALTRSVYVHRPVIPSDARLFPGGLPPSLLAPVASVASPSKFPLELQSWVPDKLPTSPFA